MHPKEGQGQEDDANSSAEGCSPCRAAHRESDTLQNKSRTNPEPFCCGLAAVPAARWDKNGQCAEALTTMWASPLSSAEEPSVTPRLRGLWGQEVGLVLHEQDSACAEEHELGQASNKELGFHSVLNRTL